MNDIARYLAFVAAGVLVGIWFMVAFSALLLNMLAPLLGDAAIAVAMIALVVRWDHTPEDPPVYTPTPCRAC